MPKKVLLLLANGFEELEAAAFTDVIGWSRTDGEEPVNLTVGALHERIRGTWNLEVIPELMIKDSSIVDGFDALAIPGGFEEAGYYEDAYSPLFLEIIAAFNNKRKPVSSICVGALPVGKSGALAGRRGTTYAIGTERRINQLAKTGVKTERTHICEDDNIVTSCGPSSALDVAFLLLETLTSEKNRKTVQRAMGFKETRFQENSDD